MGICPLPLTNLTVLIFTTEGLACLAKGLKEEGAPCTKPVVCATGAETGSKKVASPKPAMIQARVQPTMVHFLKDNFPNLILSPYLSSNFLNFAFTRRLSARINHTVQFNSSWSNFKGIFESKSR
jgi:hypothetical protein